ncbi:MAG: cytidylyltransferase domain-containing protein [Halodesulfovibrio sp.]|uniref:RraA family protein n=1 Tax=Halodesulfovibrio sp. TaxID=1912772 RepID=UPI00359EEED2
MKVYAFLPAKGNSERISSKNNRFLSGERLFIRGLKKLLGCSKIDKVFLDTESKEMHESSDYLDCEHMYRDQVLASNATDGNALFLNEVLNYPDADIYIQYLCTAPFIHPENIDRGIQILNDHPEYDSIVFMKKEKQYTWKDGAPAYDLNNIPNSVDLDDTLIETMGLYIIRKEAALKTKRRIGERPYMLFGDPIESIDVNFPEEFELAETIARGHQSKEFQSLNLLRHFVSAPMLSDIIDDLEVETGEICGGVLCGLKANIEGAAIIGRAKTLHLRPLKHDENFSGIYDALNSYEGITTHDIIVVQNDLPEFAYFGDLNARLAIRAGASGVILNSKTRDVERVKGLKLPVFSKGRNARDVRRRATVESMNAKITLDGTTVCPGDLIFADSDSVIIIYSKYEKCVLELVMKKIESENNISRDIILQKGVETLLEENGTF